MLMTGAKIIVETLIEQGVDKIFGYPGGTVLNIYDELYKACDKITHYVSCHEQGAVHAADGYARATGKTGVVIATSGPGATNLVTGIANAYLDSTPLLAITGNVANSFLGKDSFQEVDILGVTMPLTKHNYIFKDVAKLADTIRDAIKIANSGRPGPVLIDVPKDVQIASAEFVSKPKVTSSKRCAPINDAALKRAVEIISASKRPFIYAGGGVVASDAGKELIELSERIDAPIGTSMMGLSAVAADYPRMLGMTGMHGKLAANRAMARADLLIAIGTRFSDRATGNKREFTNGKKVLHIDIDPAEIGKNIPAYLSLVSDVKCALKKLLAIVEKTSRDDWKAEIDALCCRADNRLDMNSERLNPQAIIGAVCNKADENTVIATDVGQHQMWTAQYYRFKKPRTFITSGGLGAMGFGMGAAIGAAIGTENRAVLFTSDGSFHMNMNELATAVTFNLPLTVVILNNNALGMVRQWQTLFFGCRYSNTTLNRKTDFVALAEAFGAKGLRITRPDQIESAIGFAFSQNSPVVIDAVIDSDEKVLPMIPPNGTINDIILK
jgi:acetolactate synthase-1/2/3 large subunit